MATDLSNLDKFLKKDTSISVSVESEQQYCSSVKEILARAKQAGIQTFPLDIRQLVNKLFHIEIEEADLGRDVSGFLERIDSKWKIYVNRFESEARKRFTIAHELGHFVCHREKYASGEITAPDQIFFRDDSLSTTEKEANDFAANLLIPEDLFREQVKLGNRKIIDLAAKFKLSTAAVKYRAFKLGMLAGYK